MYQIRHSNLNALIRRYYEEKIALFIFGGFGIGKSYLVRNNAKKIAKEKEKTFVEWNKINKETKEKIVKNPSGYFVFIDIRLSEYDAGDLKLPNFKDVSDTFEWKIPLWCKLLTHPDSDGILFFDEINLSSRLTIASVYKIIYDRFIEEHSINDNWFIIGAGNREQDKAYVQNLPNPVRDRGGEVELMNPSIKEWTDWAIDYGIDSRIIGFLNFSSENLYDIDEKDKQKNTTPRGWERVSVLIKNVKNYQEMDMIVSSAIGQGIAKKFVSFCRIQDRMNLQEVIDNPEKISNIEKLDTKYFLVTSLADMYRDKKVDFNKIMDVSRVLEKDKKAFVSLLWRMCNQYTKDSERFSKDITKSDDEIIERMAKYIW